MKKALKALCLLLLFSLLFAGRSLAGVKCLLLISSPSKGSASPEEVLGLERERLSLNASAILQVTNPNPYAIQGYQLRVSLGEVRNEIGTSFKIEDQSGTPLPYCFEQPDGECAAGPATDIIWIKLPRIEAGGSLSLLFLKNKGYAVDGSGVFDLYEDFNKTDSGLTCLETPGWEALFSSSPTCDGDYLRGPFWFINNEKIFPAGNIVAEARAKNGGNFRDFGLAFLNSAGNPGRVDAVLFSSDGENVCLDFQGDWGPQWHVHARWATTVLKINTTFGQFFFGLHVKSNGRVSVYSDTFSETTVTTSLTSTDPFVFTCSGLKVAFSSNYTSNGFDWIRVRKAPDIALTYTWKK